MEAYRNLMQTMFSLYRGLLVRPPRPPAPAPPAGLARGGPPLSARGRARGGLAGEG